MNSRSAKTAISLPKELLEKTDAIALDLHTTRSALVAQALTEFIERRENQKLLATLNTIYEDEPLTEEEVTWLEGSKSYYQENLTQEW